MARIDLQEAMTPSLLDRLIDPDSAGTSAQPGYTAAKMIQRVQRDLEDLLNTRQTNTDLPVAILEPLAGEDGEPLRVDLQATVLGFGLPDLTSLNAVTVQQREEIGREIEAAVIRFEPRLQDVRATMVDPGDGKERTVRFRIEARLRVDPAPEDVSFDTVLELTTGHYSVKPN